MLAHVLVWQAAVEKDDAAMKAQLNALSEFVERGSLPDEVRMQVAGIPRSRLRGSCLEHYEYLCGDEGWLA